jgi:hypothetical protein
MVIFAGVLLVCAFIAGGVVLHMMIEVIRHRKGWTKDEEEL